eukprot:TRINITY_DN9576_c0_g1_i2.p1 TRINITY_DN9576_c0_g1~~TRINITY_DN9576_c0_g1_i2.p1  ORF type:complete len:1244 (+),score=280.92 TRINITY_DN9576_c0_g1_i2:112-3732(+)
MESGGAGAGPHASPGAPPTTLRRGSSLRKRAESLLGVPGWGGIGLSPLPSPSAGTNHLEPGGRHDHASRAETASHTRSPMPSSLSGVLPVALSKRRELESFEADHQHRVHERRESLARNRARLRLVDSQLSKGAVGAAEAEAMRRERVDLMAYVNRDEVAIMELDQELEKKREWLELNEFEKQAWRAHRVVERIAEERRQSAGAATAAMKLRQVAKKIGQESRQRLLTHLQSALQKQRAAQEAADALRQEEDELRRQLLLAEEEYAALGSVLDSQIPSAQAAAGMVEPHRRRARYQELRASVLPRLQEGIREKQRAAARAAEPDLNADEERALRGHMAERAAQEKKRQQQEEEEARRRRIAVARGQKDLRRDLRPEDDLRQAVRSKTELSQQQEKHRDHAVGLVRWHQRQLERARQMVQGAMRHEGAAAELLQLRSQLGAAEVRAQEMLEEIDKAHQTNQALCELTHDEKTQQRLLQREHQGRGSQADDGPAKVTLSVRVTPGLTLSAAVERLGIMLSQDLTVLGVAPGSAASRTSVCMDSWELFEVSGARGLKNWDAAEAALQRAPGALVEFVLRLRPDLGMRRQSGLDLLQRRRTLALAVDMARRLSRGVSQRTSIRRNTAAEQRAESPPQRAASMQALRQAASMAAMNRLSPESRPSCASPSAPPASPQHVPGTPPAPPDDLLPPREVVALRRQVRGQPSRPRPLDGGVADFWGAQQPDAAGAPDRPDSGLASSWNSDLATTCLYIVGDGLDDFGQLASAARGAAGAVLPESLAAAAGALATAAAAAVAPPPRSPAPLEHQLLEATFVNSAANTPAVGDLQPVPLSVTCASPRVLSPPTVPMEAAVHFPPANLSAYGRQDLTTYSFPVSPDVGGLRPTPGSCGSGALPAGLRPATAEEAPPVRYPALDTPLLLEQRAEAPEHEHEEEAPGTPSPQRSPAPFFPLDLLVEGARNGCSGRYRRLPGSSFNCLPVWALAAPSEAEAPVSPGPRQSQGAQAPLPVQRRRRLLARRRRPGSLCREHGVAAQRRPAPRAPAAFRRRLAATAVPACRPQHLGHAYQHRAPPPAAPGARRDSSLGLRSGRLRPSRLAALPLRQHGGAAESVVPQGGGVPRAGPRRGAERAGRHRGHPHAVQPQARRALRQPRAAVPPRAVGGAAAPRPARPGLPLAGRSALVGQDAAGAQRAYPGAQSALPGAGAAAAPPG